MRHQLRLIRWGQINKYDDATVGSGAQVIAGVFAFRLFTLTRPFNKAN